MFVYIGLFGNLQLKQQLKIILLQILPNTLKLHFQNARFKTNTFSKTHFYNSLSKQILSVNDFYAKWQPHSL